MLLDKSIDPVFLKNTLLFSGCSNYVRAGINYMEGTTMALDIAIWIIGLALFAWLVAKAYGALMKTETAKQWFGEWLQQSPGMMTFNGIGMLVTAIFLLFGLPTSYQVPFIAYFATVGVVASHLSSLFMLNRNKAPQAALAGPIVIIVLAVAYVSLIYLTV